TSDSLNANITFGINASNVSDVKLNLNTLEGVIVSNLRFALFHNGVEVFVIDNPLTVSGTGNITNLVLSDSSSNQLSNVNSYPISGIYRPQHLLSSFDNLGA
ncbi:MAG: hypothetical protein NTU73_07865, partial [Ignavibacteriae bacterium]|nr:hypothetical protein [Ignavibacteriota bacterium]